MSMVKIYSLELAATLIANGNKLGEVFSKRRFQKACFTFEETEKLKNDIELIESGKDQTSVCQFIDARSFLIAILSAKAKERLNY